MSFSEIPLAEKYRPKTIQDIVGNDDVRRAIAELLVHKDLPNMLFCGRPGTGKTSMAKAIARQLYGSESSTDVLEMNASSEKGIDTIREKVKNFAKSMSFLGSKCKFLILDEADAMTKDAQNALRRIIEDYSNNVRFCFICNFAANIIDAIKSRTAAFWFVNITDEDITEQLSRIADIENIDLTPSGLDALVAYSKGDMRKAINSLDGLRKGFSRIDEDAVNCFFYLLSDVLIKEIITNVRLLRYGESAKYIIHVQKTKHISLKTLVLQIANVLRRSVEHHVIRDILSELADIEYVLDDGQNELPKLCYLVGILKRIDVKLS